LSSSSERVPPASYRIHAFAAQTIQHDTDLLFSRILLPRRRGIAGSIRLALQREVTGPNYRPELISVVQALREEGIPLAWDRTAQDEPTVEILDAIGVFLEAGQLDLAKTAARTYSRGLLQSREG
jgi:hypothetical protein